MDFLRHEYVRDQRQLTMITVWGLLIHLMVAMTNTDDPDFFESYRSLPLEQTVENCSGYPTPTEERLRRLKLELPTFRLQINSSKWIADVNAGDVAICRVTLRTCEPAVDAVDGWRMLCCGNLAFALRRLVIRLAWVIEDYSRDPVRSWLYSTELTIKKCQRCPLSCVMALETAEDLFLWTVTARSMTSRSYYDVIGKQIIQLFWPTGVEVMMATLADWHQDVWWDVLWRMSANDTPDVSVLSWKHPFWGDDDGCYLLTPGPLPGRVEWDRPDYASQVDWLSGHPPRDWVPGRRMAWCVTQTTSVPSPCLVYTVRWWANVTAPSWRDATAPRNGTLTGLVHLWPWDNWTAPTTSSEPITLSAVPETMNPTRVAGTALTPARWRVIDIAPRATAWSVAGGMCLGCLIAGGLWGWVFHVMGFSKLTVVVWLSGAGIMIGGWAWIGVHVFPAAFF